MWQFAPEFDAAHRAALNSGKPLVYTCPPAGWAVGPLLAKLAGADGAGLRTVVLTPDTADALDLAEAAAACDGLAPVHPATGLGRTARLVAGGAVRTLVVTPSDAVQLLGRSRLPLDDLTHVVVAWPETHARLGGERTVDTLLGECPRAQRLVVTADETAVAGFLERHAYRAPVVPAARLPEAPLGPLRYATADRDRIRFAVRAALDTLNPSTTLVWDPSPAAPSRWAGFGDPTVVFAPAVGEGRYAVALAAELPTAAALTALREVAADVVVLVRARQLAYLERLAAPLRTVRLPGEADRARERSVELRAAVRGELDRAAASAELAALAPLFDEYDPARVAAAALRTRDATPLSAAAAPEDAVPTWARIRIDAGRRDQLRPGDVVGALLNAVGLTKQDVGRVDLRERFTLVDVRAEAAERARRGLDGLSLRGRRVGARIDR